jgi:hypothetical protein
MELLLNLVWVAIALMAFCVLLRKRSAERDRHNASCATACLALACMLVLLFPVVSASDDLHPAQAVLEEATKRFQQLSAPLHHTPTVAHGGIVPLLLAVYLSFTLVARQIWRPTVQPARVIDRARLPRAGRSPPSI